ncbi:hypothetical protein N9U27_03860 [Candidatus Pelagibacter sp.]|nr:hypothetical protein [Candidatus Pelagibacter sp.]
MKVIKKYKNKIIYVSPKNIKFCIFPSKYCDYTQFELTKIHPHAGINRGVFDEDPIGKIKINNLNWDMKPGVLFTKLLEFQALRNHYLGKQNWKDSKFAKRNVNYINKKNSVRGFTNSDVYLSKRERQIDILFNSILKKGIYPNRTTKKKNIVNDNISVVLTKKKELYFNNRGHHRLSIAKILKLDKIPIKIVVAKSESLLEKFYLIND